MRLLSLFNGHPDTQHNDTEYNNKKTIHYLNHTQHFNSRHIVCPHVMLFNPSVVILNVVVLGVVGPFNVMPTGMVESTLKWNKERAGIIHTNMLT
jgi:hypothetical protein